MLRPTAKQLALIKCVVSFREEHEYGPTLRDLALLSGTTVNAVVCHVARLETKGYLTHTLQKARSLRLTPKGRAYLERPEAEQ